MGLTSIAQKAAAVAFKIAGDVKVSATLKVGPSSAYDTATDKSTVTWAHSFSLTDVLLYDREQKQGDTPEKSTVTMQKALIQAASITVRADQVKETSILVIGSEEWQVIDCAPDPSNAVLILQLQR